MKKTWRDFEDAAEIEAELVRMGFNTGDSFVIVRFEDGRLAAINDGGDDGQDFTRPWGPERHIV